jgi:hypothetical protein
MSTTIAGQLRALLDQDANSTGIVTSRNGLINRAHCARPVGITPSGLGQGYESILTQYEQQYKIATGPRAKLNQIRDWLKRAHSTANSGFANGNNAKAARMLQDLAKALILSLKP